MAAVALSRDMVDFESLEAQKENIEPLREGRSATSLAKAFSVNPVEAVVELDRVRDLFETELGNSGDLDDPLEVWVRYLTWTKEAFPAGQSVNSNYVQLLERCSKQFIRSHYANDPRYLKIWIEYARFSDDPREMFCFLARNEIGQELATFYEEYAAFLEVRNRKGQADEIYQLGILRGARPLNRLRRRYEEFSQRLNTNPPCPNEPTSPPIGQVRAALTTKLGGIPHGQQRTDSKAGKPKMQIFTDQDEPVESSQVGNGGWGSIGTLQSRRKENTVETRKMMGEKLPQHATAQYVTKLDVFKDEPTAQLVPIIAANTKTSERVVCDLEAIYALPGDELSFEELKAHAVGYLNRSWSPLRVPALPEQNVAKDSYVSVMDTRSPLKDSPRRKNMKRQAASPTINTKAAMDDILDIFSQPLKCEQSDNSSDSESDADEPDNTFPVPHNDGTWIQSGISYGSNSANHSDFDKDEERVNTDLDSTPVETADTAGEVFLPGITAAAIDENFDTKQGPSIPATPQQQMPTGRVNGFDLMTPITEDTENLQISAIRPQALAILKEDDDEDEAVQDQLYSSPFIEHPPPRPLVNSSGGAVRRPALADTMRNRLAAVPKASASDSPSRTKKGAVVNELICNPMDNAIRSVILANVNPQVSTYEGSRISNDVSYAKKFEAIEKYIRALNKKAGEATQHLEVILDFASRYSIKKKLGEGAFAPVFLVENISAVTGHYRKKYEAIKIERPGSAWEFYVMRQVHRRLGVNRASESIARAHEYYQFSDTSFLILDYQDQGTVLDLVNMCRSEAGGVDELLAMFITVELLRTVEALHSRGLMHGDLKSDNCLLRLNEVKDSEWSSVYQRDGSDGWQHKGISLIDFGRGIDLKNFENDVQFIADWKTDEQDCIEMREARPWTYQIDYHGLACIAHSLLFGKYIETVSVGGLGVGKKRHGLKNSFKRYWKQEIWEPLFDLLLNPLSHGQMPLTDSLKTCRERIENHLEQHGTAGIGLKGLIRKVEIDLALAKKRG